MNRLTIEKRAQIISMLVEGMSMQAVSRVANVSINTVAKLLEDVGTAGALYQDMALNNLQCKRIECDEIWSFCYSKEKNIAPEDKGVLGHGDVYTWVAIDADTKLAVSFMVGKRDADYGNVFMRDLAARLANRVQFTTDDGLKAYLEAVEGAFVSAIDYAMLVKTYGPGTQTDQRRNSPSEFVGVEKHRAMGTLDMEKVSTSFVERQNLTMRLSMRRATRLTNGFSKKVKNLEHAVALHFMHYNFARTHKTLRGTPAMAAGVSDHAWSIEDICGLVPRPLAGK